ncbi:YopX family protein [Paenibacillus sp. FSL H7-0716]|uniref:YopX protein domain-containing protein n=1 Tax=Paenibacillus odorifer TaxID=189426 RepID=A0AB36J4I1_9BACL|nr:YopX family protein [Paenibacillus odorifer]OME11062.1 hypothetical protein BSK47_29585 [Paenibacillus odorifer]
MGREIKFQVWDNENKCFFKDTNLAYNGVIEQLLISPAGDINFRKMDGMYHESMFPGRFVLRQYTGLKDKNGREIYEGDFIQNENTIGEIEWVQEHCAFMAFTRNPSFYRYLESDGQLNLTEIIGNIYENPELIEV